MDKLFPLEYRQGYTKALQDVLSNLEAPEFRSDLKAHNRKATLKEVINFIKCMLDNRIALQDDPDAFVRCNNEAKNGFELWFGNTRKNSSNAPDWVKEQLEYHKENDAIEKLREMLYQSDIDDQCDILICLLQLLKLEERTADDKYKTLMNLIKSLNLEERTINDKQ